MDENKKALNNESSVPENNLLQMNGFVKLYRELLNWEWYSDLPVRTLFIHCLLKANYKNTKWKGQTINAGEFITSIASLARETGLSQQQTRTALFKLKSTYELTIKTTSRYSIITVNSWRKWQTGQQANEQTSNKQSTTDKEYKNNKNNIYRERKIFQKPTIEEIKNYCLERNNSVDAQRFFDYYESKGWMIGKNKMKDWKAAIRTWEQNNTKYKNDNVSQEEIIDYDNTPYRPF